MITRLGIIVSATLVIAGCRTESTTVEWPVPESAYLGNWELASVVSVDGSCTVPCTITNVRFQAGTLALQPGRTMTQTLLVEIGSSPAETIVLTGTYAVVPHPRPTAYDDYPALILLRRTSNSSLSVARTDTAYLREGKLWLRHKYANNICLFYCKSAVPGYFALTHERSAGGP